MKPVLQSLGRVLPAIAYPAYLVRTAAFALATIAIGLIASAPATAQASFDRPGLLTLADPASTPDILSADRHVLIVRHARKISEDCNALDCPLGAAGESMVARLDTLLGEPDFDAVFSSSACRTVETVRVAGDVVQHAAAENAREMCGGGVAERARDDAIQDAVTSDARWTIVAEHSNTTCGWVAAIAGDAALSGTPCEGGRLDSSDYGDVFWLRRQADVWHLTVLEGVFDVSE
ncbi:histidine phosphatase family protein [Hyphobacterium sp.]|uniref:histidine phosphatase family protein n=1 Tax=Hyphobacterium sp. TaxID=2004662 RepID=UPI003B51C8AD